MKIGLYMKLLREYTQIRPVVSEFTASNNI